MPSRSPESSRRDFLQTSAGLVAAGTVVPYWFTGEKALAKEFKAKNDRPRIGSIGLGGQGLHDSSAARHYGDVVAVCDVDSQRAEEGKQKLSDGKADAYGDYRQVLDRKDVDVVVIAPPDHWHTKIAIEAMKAGKDIYCEKPLTLTIDEGKQIIKVLKETGRVFQVGTQQRSTAELFLTAVAMVQNGRIGKVKRVQCAIGAPPTSGPIPKADPPKGLNWERWLGQAPLVDYVYKPGGPFGNSRCHYEFRWWYEYSGGKMTDWGAHHVDIAQWAIGMDHSGPISVEGTATHPVPFKNGYPTVDNEYNAAFKFNVKCQFPNGVEMVIRHDTDNGILFEGEKGKFFVNRGKIVGKPVDELKENPLPSDALVKAYKGMKPRDHMGNFFECLTTRRQPISDVYTHHRAITTCHLANIAIRLGRKLNWDPETQQMVGDEEANTWQRRTQRKGYEIVA